MAPEDDDIEVRLERLETKLSYQEATIISLSETVYEQAQRLDRAERTIKDMRDKLKEVQDEGLPNMPHNQRPPHY